MLYIGKNVQDRMGLLGLIVEEIADKTFLEEKMITAIINNQIPLEEIEEFDFSLICSVLYCQEDSFTNSEAREKDLLSASMNRELNNKQSMNVKARLQDFMRDFAFVIEILSEMNGGINLQREQVQESFQAVDGFLSGAETFCL